MNIGELRLFLSGGGGNTDPNLAIGGAISTTEVQSQSAATTIAGITVVDGIGNPIGDGALAYAQAATTATWASNGDTAGDGVDISADGRYVLASATNGYLVIDVVAASLPGVDTTDINVTVTDVVNGLFDDISPVESSVGDAEYRCLYLKNISSASDANTARVWVDSDASGADSIEIGVGTAGENLTEQLVADEGTAPSGVTFSAPADYANGIALGDLAAGDYIAFWAKRSVPADTAVSTASDNFKIGYGAELV